MNLAAEAPTWLLLVLALLLAAAAVEDAVRLRISNLTCALILIAVTGGRPDKNLTNPPAYKFAARSHASILLHAGRGFFACRHLHR